MLHRRLLLASPTILALPARAQAWPSRPVRIIVPYPAGQSADILGRVMAEQLTKALGQQVIVENKPGAGGTIGVDVAAKAAPDGYTLVIITISTHIIAPAVYPKLPYDPVKDFAAIANVAQTPQTLITSPKSGIGSVKELIEKARGGDLNFGSSGNGSAAHLAVELMLYAAGIRMTHVPFKGNADAQMALQSGDIQLMADAVPAIVGPIRAGRVTAIGVCEHKRSAYLPDVPTVAEQGYPYVIAVGSIGLGAPAGTPAPILDRLAAEVQRMLAEPAMVDRLKTLYFVPAGESRGGYSDFIASEIVRWRTIVQVAGVKVE
ncbi:MAG: tripartite tricarboxylate transporter substrate binding protein [Alphaproteobacteria bacterium]|nr:tripartite tricarboxylate transporter substrate binding protein [Alphaproteobacteria bacterium]